MLRLLNNLSAEKKGLLYKLIGDHLAGIAPRMDPTKNDVISLPYREEPYYSGAFNEQVPEPQSNMQAIVPPGNYSARMIPQTPEDLYGKIIPRSFLT